jgi:hypothetical protein
LHFPYRHPFLVSSNISAIGLRSRLSARGLRLLSRSTIKRLSLLLFACGHCALLVLDWHAELRKTAMDGRLTANAPAVKQHRGRQPSCGSATPTYSSPSTPLDRLPQPPSSSSTRRHDRDAICFPTWGFIGAAGFVHTLARSEVLHSPERRCGIHCQE